jgi:hypothetical protein
MSLRFWGSPGKALYNCWRISNRRDSLRRILSHLTLIRIGSIRSKEAPLARPYSPHPFFRESAEKALVEFMDRVQEVNEDGRFLFRVRKVVLFGSFLIGSATLGDLDIAVELVPKEADAKKHSELILARANEAALNGKSFRNFIERLDFAAQEVRSFLKSRSRIIQLTDCQDGVLKIAEHRVIYEGPRPTPAAPINPAPKRRVRRPRKVDKDCPF